MIARAKTNEAFVDKKKKTVALKRNQWIIKMGWGLFNGFFFSIKNCAFSYGSHRRSWNIHTCILNYLNKKIYISISNVCM